MESNYIKWSTITLGLFLLGIGNSFAQDPVSVSIDSKTLYQHGYNSDHNDLNDPPSAREATDTVMVEAVMPYFIMPDENYNTAYFGQTTMDYGKTNLTTSKFTWTVTNGTAAIPSGKANATGTSPLVNITWSSTPTASPFTISMTETAQYNSSDLCAGDPAEISVIVIAKPTAKFLTTENMECVADDPATTPKTLSFPVTFTSSSSEIEVTYTVNDGTGPSAPAKKRLTASGGLEIEADKYGTFTVIITKVTDRIARKCNMEIPVSSDNQYAYTILPAPKPGKAYHVPNMFE